MTGTSDAPIVAVAHYPEGAGHATRMLAVADELAAAGADVLMAGGGAGSRFVALNGYDEFEPTTVDYIDTYQGGSLRQVLAESVPATASRVTDYVEWLREQEPDALVTDDMFAAMATLRVGVPLYVLKHDMPGLYRNRLERAGAAFHTDFQHAAARAFFYPAVWPDGELAPEGAMRVPPVALEASAPGHEREHRHDHGCEDADVVVVPSHYSDLGRIAAALEREGRDVIDVGSDDWDPVPSLLPYLRDADVVVCSGYSTVMDAAVAGTPCVVYPATDEQEAVAERLDDADVTGFAVADGPLDVLDGVADPPAPPAHENGAGVVAEAVLDDLRQYRSTAASTDDAPAGSEGSDRGPVSAGHATAGRTRRAARGAVDRVVAGAVALGTLLWAVVLRGRSHAIAAARRAVRTGRTLRERLSSARQRATGAVRDGTAALIARFRATIRGCRRYALATAAVAAAVLVFTRCRLRRTRQSLGGTIDATTTALGSTLRRCRRGMTVATRRLGGSAVTLAAAVERSGRSLKDAVVSTVGRE